MASGDTLIILTPQNCTPPETVPATLDVIQGADSVSKESFPVLDFDAAQDEYMDWFAVMPKNYVGTTGITCTIVWAAISDQTNACQFEAALRAIEDDTEDIDTTDHVYDFNVVAASPANTAGEASYDDITFTDGADMDNVGAGDYFVFRLMRDVSDDSMTGDASVLAIHIKET
jgi:hypothetical protein